MGGWHSDDDETSLPSAPPHPDGGSSYDDDNEVIAPAWVQRLYGPPPPSGPGAVVVLPQPQPAPVWVAPSPGPYMQYAPGTQPQLQPSPYAMHAYTSPGILPPGAAVLRARSPSTSTGLHAGGGGGSGSNSDEDDYIIPPRPQPFQASPTKTPLFEGKHTPFSSSTDIEAGGQKVNNNRNNGKENFANPNMPSRNEAIRERRKQQLRTCDKDSFGVPLPSTRRPFSLFASPFSIAEVCTGLGVYLASLQAAVLLALMLSVLCIYPLVDDIKTQRWAQDYTLVVHGVSLVC